MYCEMCFLERVVAWYLVDNDYEVELCRKCARALRETAHPVEKLNV